MNTTKKTAPTSAAKIFISYPPLSSQKGKPFLSQNRQFQWTNTGNIIYPVIPAYGASALKKLGYDVYWDDAIAKNLTYKVWLKNLITKKPNLVFIESKTPVIKRHWQIIKDIKKASSKIVDWRLKIILMGDHVTALPKESFSMCPVDYVITGGDYDFMMINLANHLYKGEKLEPGFYYRSHSKTKSLLNYSSNILNSGPFALKHHHLDVLPIIDRQLTNWELYAYENTNYKYTPGSYMMTGRDCWWGKCTFCSWTTTHPFGTFRTFSVKHTLDEVENLINLGVKEIFDDSGTFPVGKWLEDFCNGMIDRGFHKKIKFGCNMRFGALNQEQYNLMGKAGFRFILYGLESSNQNTLNRIAKLTKTEDARKTLTMAKKAGLEPHLTIMIGYPWEKMSDAQKTLDEAKSLFRDGLADSMQATRIIAYPGTPLFAEAKRKKWLLTDDWDDYDMRQAVMKSPLTHQQQEELIQNLFKGVLTPKFLIRKVISIRSLADIKYLYTYATKFLKKLQDFPKNPIH